MNEPHHNNRRDSIGNSKKKRESSKPKSSQLTSAKSTNNQFYNDYKQQYKQEQREKTQNLILKGLSMNQNSNLEQYHQNINDFINYADELDSPQKENKIPNKYKINDNLNKNSLNNKKSSPTFTQKNKIPSNLIQGNEVINTFKSNRPSTPQTKKINPTSKTKTNSTKITHINDPFINDNFIKKENFTHIDISRKVKKYESSSGINKDYMNLGDFTKINSNNPYNNVSLGNVNQSLSIKSKNANVGKNSHIKVFGSNRQNTQINYNLIHKDYRRKKLTFEEAAVIIQRRFRIYYKNLISDPKYQVRNLLKKKKVNILKNYNINVQNSKLFDEYSSMDMTKKLHTEDNIDQKISNCTVKETGGFAYEINKSHKKDDHLLRIGEEMNDLSNKSKKQDDKHNPYSIYTDDFQNKFIDTENSDINFLNDNLNDLNDKRKIEKNNINKEKDFIEEDLNLEKLKKSLDSYTKQNLNKFNTMGTTPRSGIDTGRFQQSNPQEKKADNDKHIKDKRNKQKSERDESYILDLFINKDQTIINKNDVSDTVNIYEKMFKDIKKDSRSDKDLNTYNNSLLENNKNINNITDKDIVNFDAKSYLSEKENVIQIKKDNISNNNKSQIENDLKKDQKLKEEQLSKYGNLKNFNHYKENNELDKSKNKNDNNQEEAAVFLNNLNYIKVDNKDLNNFFSPHSQINNKTSMKNINQSHLSSFNNHEENSLVKDNLDNIKSKSNNKNSTNKSSELKEKKLNIDNKLSYEDKQTDSKNDNKEFFENINSLNKKDGNGKRIEEYTTKITSFERKNVKENDEIELKSKRLEKDRNEYYDSNNNIDDIINNSLNSKINQVSNYKNEIKVETSIDKNKQLKEQNEERLKKLHDILEKEDNNVLIDNKYSEFDYNLNSKNSNYSNINNTNTAEILNIVLELKESKKTIISMKDIIDELKKESKNKDEFHKKNLDEKLSIQKYEFEKIIDRQKEVIENLLNEKKKLTTCLNELNEKYDICEKSSQKKVSQMLENFDLELKKNKDAWFQAEKIRRKKWEETKIKEIKDITVKGLEPEYNRMFARHKNEIQILEDKAIEDQRKLREKLTDEFERRLSEAKDRFIKEKEEALEHERTLASQRLRNQNERIEEEYSEERKRWGSNIQAEVQRVEKLRENDKKIYEDQILTIEQRNLKLLEEKENYYKLKISEMEKRFEDKIKSEQNELFLKLQKEKDKFVEEKGKEIDQKLKEAKHDFIKDRDKQLQLVIDKLGEETLIEKKKLLIECEAKADIINKELRQEKEIMMKKIHELSDKLTAESKLRFNLEENLENFSNKLKDKENVLTKKEKLVHETNKNYNEISEKYSNIAREFNKEKIEIEYEFKSKLQKFESEMKLLIEKNESQKNYYDNMIVDIQKNHKDEINEIEEKIKKALNRKDDIIKKLQEDMQVKELSIKKLEDLLAKQRKELLMMGN